MSQRNPMNERNQNRDELKGKTRRSAASAKPVTKAASSVYIKSANASAPKPGFLSRLIHGDNRSEKELKQEAERKAARKEENHRKDEIRRFRPKNNPEYRKWRIIWAGFLLLGLVIVLIAAIFSAQLGDVSMWAMVLAWGCLTASIVTDIKKIRPLREELYYKEHKKSKKKNH